MLIWDNSDIHDSSSHVLNHTCGLSVLPEAHEEGGKGVKGGRETLLQVTNTEFVAAVFSGLPEGAVAALCTKRGDPSAGSWRALPSMDWIDRLIASNNNFVNCSR